MSQIPANLPVRATKSAASSLSSDYNQMLFDALIEGHVMRRKKPSAVWNCPRKAIKIVDSMGRIEKKLKPESKSLKSARENAKFNKYKRKMKDCVKRHNRVLELAKPKIIRTNSWKARNDSTKNSKQAVAEKKSCIVLIQKNYRRLSGAPKITDSSIKNPTQNIVRGETLVLTKEPHIKMYKPSERTKKLAEPRARHETEIRLPGKVAESALFATASTRLIELATPKNKLREAGLREKEDNSTVKKNAFTVSREALRATCSPRIANLSIPKSQRILERGKNGQKINTGITS